MLVFCGRNVCMTSLASTPPSYSFHHTYSSTIFFKLCRDEERIQLPIHTGPFRQHQRNQTCQNLPRFHSRIQRIQRSLCVNKRSQKDFQEEIVQEGNGMHSQVPVYSWSF
jgi:hypothetical protein